MNAMGILPRFCGVAIHDFWKPYLSFESCRHVFCGAHLLRELEGVKEKDQIHWPEPWLIFFSESSRHKRIVEG